MKGKYDKLCNAEAPLHVHPKENTYTHHHFSLIGKYGYLKDNSYSREIRSGNQYILSGYEHEKPFKVLIVSEPYKLKITNLIGEYTAENEFITVMYAEKCHVVLNSIYIIDEEEDV